VLAQGEIDDQKRIILRNEQTFGVFLNSNGIGGDFSYFKRINARNHQMYQLGLMIVKHPKEVKISDSYYSQKSFVFGKQNFFLELRGQYGRSSEIFRKNDLGGVSIRYLYSIGPNIGILKPIYYEILYASGTTEGTYTQIEKFNTTIHGSNILGRASFFKGVDEVKIIPGISVKMGFLFEYSRQDTEVNALEVGIGMDLFPKDVPIMATEANNFFFTNLYVGYRFGKVINISEAAQSKSLREKLDDRKQQRQILKRQKNAGRENDLY
jgi:hypothetical protein